MDVVEIVSRVAGRVDEIRTGGCRIQYAQPFGSLAASDSVAISIVSVEDVTYLGGFESLNTLRKSGAPAKGRRTGATE